MDIEIFNLKNAVQVGVKINFSGEITPLMAAHITGIVPFGLLFFLFLVYYGIHRLFCLLFFVIYIYDVFLSHICS